MISDEEDLFHFILYPDDWQRDAEGTIRIRSKKFKTSHPLSFNQGSIWPLAKHLELAREGWGVCSVLGRDLRGIYRPEFDLPPGDARRRGPVDIAAAPLELDPLLQVPNPSHANVNRTLKASEAEALAAHASRRLHHPPSQ